MQESAYANLQKEIDAAKSGIVTELAAKAAASGSASEAIGCKLSAVTAGYDKFDKNN